jgi:hypothetical protein
MMAVETVEAETPTMAAAEQAATPETAAVVMPPVRGEAQRAVLLTAPLTDQPVAGVWHLLGKVLQGVLTMGVPEVLAEKQLQRDKTRIPPLVMLLAPAVVMVAVAVAVVLATP